MADVAAKAKQSVSQYEGRITVAVSPVMGTTQQRDPAVNKVTPVTVIEAKYDKYFDDTNYYSA